MTQINLAVIGCGRMGKMHIQNLQRFHKHICLEAVVDAKPDHDWLAPYKVPLITSDLHQVLNTTSIDAVLIAAPSSEHVSLIQQAAKAKKAIFCEKPIALTLEGIQLARAAVLENDVKCQVGFNRRFDPSFKKVREHFLKGDLGTLYSVRITNRDPRRPNLAFIPQSGGLFLDFNVHDFDTLRFVTDKPIEEIQAFGSNLIDPEIGKLGDIDTAIISCTLAGGGLASIDASREAVYGYDQRLEVLGSKGSMTAENQVGNTLVRSLETHIATDPLLTTFVERYSQAYQNQMKGFVDYLTTDAKPPADLNDALHALACALAADLSMREKRVVHTQELL